MTVNGGFLIDVRRLNGVETASTVDRKKRATFIFFTIALTNQIHNIT